MTHPSNFVFYVLKSSLDGLCGANHAMSLKRVCEEISYHRGWETLEQLHDAIRTWGAKAQPGEIFKTPASAVVVGPREVGDELDRDECASCDECDLDYDEIELGEDDRFRQGVSCPHCGATWTDIYTLTSRDWP